MLLGAPFSQAVAMLPFILVGLGVDDAFVIVGEIRNVDPHLVLPVKVGSGEGRSPRHHHPA